MKPSELRPLSEDWQQAALVLDPKLAPVSGEVSDPCFGGLSGGHFAVDTSSDKKKNSPEKILISSAMI